MADRAGGTGARGPGRPIDPAAEMAGLWGSPAGSRAPAADTAAPSPDGPEHRPLFHGSGGALFGIYVVNALLTLVTVGIYYFWARVRVRRYLASQTEFEGDRFAYHGTGKELLIGTAKAGLLFALPFALLNVVPWLEPGWWVASGALVAGYALFAVLIPLAIVGARRYRLSRTSWRGIRFSFRGPALEFVKLFVKGGLLTVVTLGLYYPVFTAHRQAFLVSHSYFGTRRFAFDGRARELFRIYALAFLLWLPTLGLYYFWFQARKQRYLWNHTAFDAARFRSTVTGGRLLALQLVNALLLVLTLGVAWPWVTARNVRFAFQYLSLVGALDVAGIQQQAQAASATGEGLAGFLDTGLELDV
jgi:uncharacterized membrane protein YjgN (DUF898 family)